VLASVWGAHSYGEARTGINSVEQQGGAREGSRTFYIKLRERDILGEESLTKVANGGKDAHQCDASPAIALSMSPPVISLHLDYARSIRDKRRGGKHRGKRGKLYSFIISLNKKKISIAITAIAATVCPACEINQPPDESPARYARESSRSSGKLQPRYREYTVNFLGTNLVTRYRTGGHVAVIILLHAAPCSLS